MDHSWTSDAPPSHDDNRGQVWASVPTVRGGFAPAPSKLQDAHRSVQPIKGPWLPTEDQQLVSLIKELTTAKWGDIAKRIGTRTGKQCRERWHNHLDPMSAFSVGRAPCA
jgi:hypothetical protein